MAHYSLSLATFFMFGSFIFSFGASLYQDFDITWGNGRGKLVENGKILSLSLDQTSGSGFESKKEFMFGKIDMQIKLVPGNSAGTVTAYYLSSQGANHDEIDFEFLGNLSGDPYTLHTNVYSQGKGGREQQFRLWFDPSANFHTYSILWNPKNIIFLVDNTPVREFKNHEPMGVPFPKNQPMKLYSSIYNADQWATRGGLIKTDWSQAPFTTAYSNFKAEACLWENGKALCGGAKRGRGSKQWLEAELDGMSREKMRWVQSNHKIYDYCTDLKRFPQGFPPECKVK